MNNNSDNSGLLSEIISWGIIVICFSAFWPLGIFLLIRKLSRSGSSTSQNTKSGYTTSRPAATYSNTTIGSEHSAAFRQARGESPQAARPAGKQSSQSASGSGSQSNSKNRGNAMPVILLIVGVMLAITGLGSVSNAISGIGISGSYVLREALQALFYLAGGAASFFSAFFMKKRSSRFDKLKLVFGTRDVMSVKDMAAASGFEEKRVRKDLEIMADKGYFGPNAYFDKGLDSIVTSPEKAEQARTTAYAAEKAAEKAAKNEKLSEYETVLRQLRKLDDDIEDETISQKIVHIEDITGKIFDIVTANPEKLPQIKKFMDYYLPTTLKLLRSYSVMEGQGIEGENITVTKARIDKILDTLSAGFEQQLDQLFQADAMDISSDIQVLETMMKNDGLQQDGGFAVQKKPM